VAGAGGYDEDLTFLHRYEVARDTAGVFHVVVYDSPSAGPGTLTYFQKSGSGLAQVGPAPVTDGDGGKGLSLVIGPNNTPVMSYYATATGGIRLSAFDGTTWSHEDLDTTGISHTSRVQFDGAGHLHVAYQDVASGGVKLVDEVCQ
jgi:hypothetical protein